MKTTLSCFALLFCLLGSGSIDAQINFFPEELVVNASTLNLRDKPDKTGKVVEKLPRGAELKLLETVNFGQYVEVDSTYGAWLKVQYKNKTGYVFSPHVMGQFNLYQDGEIFDEALPKLNWYGIYLRDSFADEMRKIEVRLEKSYNELYGGEVTVLKTNQKETSKFLIGTSQTLTPGLVGNLGIFDPGTFYMSNELAPGAMMPIYPGQDINDTTVYNTYYLAAIGCAQFEENDFVRVRDYRLFAFESLNGGPSPRQDLTGWVQPSEGMNPSVNLVWFGDIDRDRKPDALIQDAPYETGVRMSLFLSSKARPGAFLHKVCEYFYPID